MASARKKSKVTEVIESVILTLTQEEAETLHAITYRVGGDPRTTRRKHVDSIRRALTETGIDRDTDDIITGAAFSDRGSL